MEYRVWELTNEKIDRNDNDFICTCNSDRIDNWENMPCERMDNMIDLEILQKAIDKWGKKPQTIVACEELGELQKELFKLLRGKNDLDHLAEEFADVLIMLEQIKLMYFTQETYERLADFIYLKMNRLKNNLNK